MSARTWPEWIAAYAASHQHPVNQRCHAVGIPLIVVSLVLGILGLFVHTLWWWALAFFLVGWVFQFVGHAFERKPPEFFKDWRFLFVGVRWWWKKMAGDVLAK